MIPKSRGIIAEAALESMPSACASPIPQTLLNLAKAENHTMHAVQSPHFVPINSQGDAETGL